MFFGATLVVAAAFIAASPFPAAVDLVLTAPPVVITGWIWVGVVLRRDAEQLQRITAFVTRRRRRS